jgi:hypothetical protein
MQRHPLEYVADNLRITENPFNGMKNKSLLLTNFPSGLKITQKFLKELCAEGDKNALVSNIRVQQAMKGDTS